MSVQKDCAGTVYLCSRKPTNKLTQPKYEKQQQHLCPHEHHLHHRYDRCPAGCRYSGGHDGEVCHLGIGGGNCMGHLCHTCRETEARLLRPGDGAAHKSRTFLQKERRRHHGEAGRPHYEC